MKFIEQAAYSEIADLSNFLEDTIFSYCSFKNLTAEGKSVDARFLSCEFTEVNWYWGLFNCCVFIDTTFERCVFLGTSFSSCRFLNCTFLDCSFIQDNMGSPCSFDESQWFLSSSAGTVGLPENAVQG